MSLIYLNYVKVLIELTIILGFMIHTCKFCGCKANRVIDIDTRIHKIS